MYRFRLAQAPPSLRLSRSSRLSIVALAMLTLAAVALTSGGPRDAHATSIVVTSTADGDLAELAGNGTCDLREAITAANGDVATGECPAGNGPDLITFAGSGPRTIGLMSDLPNLTDDVTIDGDGVTTITRGGDDLQRHFVVGSGEVTIDGFTLTGASATSVNLDLFFSGAPEAALHVRNSVITGNGDFGGHGIVVRGFGKSLELTVENTTIVDNGTNGIAVNASWEFESPSTFNMTMRNSTIASNDFTGLDVSLWAHGTVEIVNSTIVDNGRVWDGVTEQGVIVWPSTVDGADSTVHIANSTIAGNGGTALVAGAETTVENSIVAESVTGNCSGVVNGGNNLSDDDTCAAAAFTQVAQPSLLLLPLGDYGGPTLTRMPMAGSSAIGVGNPAVCASAPVNGEDQRGEPRDATCDAGAVERQSDDVDPSIGVLIVTTDEDETLSPGDGCSLREAITVANQTAGASAYPECGLGNLAGLDTITFDTGAMASTTIVLAGTRLPVISSDITIDGGATVITIDGNGETNHLETQADTTVRLSMLALVHGRTPDNPDLYGAILSRGDLFVDRVTVADATASYGGALVAIEGNVTIMNSTFRNNRAVGQGGAMNVQTATVTVANSTFVDNAAEAGGGTFAVVNEIYLYHNTIVAGPASANRGGRLLFGPSSTVVLEGNILAGSGAVQDCSPVPGAALSGSNNLTDAPSCVMGSIATLVDDLGLDPAGLAANGGPTETILLMPGSPAIDAVPANACPPPATDQRGLPRPVNNTGLAQPRCDAGALELQDVVSPPDLVLSKTVDRASAAPGATLLYTLAVANEGENALNAVDVTVEDTLPEGVTFVSASEGCAESGGTVTCTADTLASGDSAVFTIEVTVASDIADNTTLVNRATAASANEEARTDNNTGTVATFIAAPQDLAVVKVVSGSNQRAGDVVRYNLTVTNTAPAGTADNVVLTDELPPNSTLVSVDGPTAWLCDEDDDVADLLVCETDRMEPGETATFTVRVRLDANATGEVVNWAEVSSDDRDPDMSNNRAVSRITVTEGSTVPQPPIPAPSNTPTSTPTSTPTETPTAQPTATPTEEPTTEPGTFAYELSFRWTLLTWYGADGITMDDALDAIIGDVTAVYGWSDGEWLGFFPDGVGIPGANDLTSLEFGQAYWIAIDAEGGIAWAIATDDAFDD